MRNTLAELGVERRRALVALEEASRYSIQQMHWIIRSRRGLERAAKGTQGPPEGGRPGICGRRAPHRWRDSG